MIDRTCSVIVRQMRSSAGSSCSSSSNTVHGGVVHVAVTRSPSDTSVAQQAREAIPFGVGPHFLICDNDDKYGLPLERAIVGVHTELLHTPLAAPRANSL
jgi:hypothetical protein